MIFLIIFPIFAIRLVLGGHEPNLNSFKRADDSQFAKGNRKSSYSLSDNLIGVGEEPFIKGAQSDPERPTIGLFDSSSEQVHTETIIKASRAFPF